MAILKELLHILNEIMLLKDFHTVSTQQTCVFFSLDILLNYGSMFEILVYKPMFLWNAHHIDIHHYYSYPVITSFMHSCKQILIG